MNDMVIRHDQPTGEMCLHCDCELVLVSAAGESQLHLECDCGVVSCLGSAVAAAVRSLNLQRSG